MDYSDERTPDMARTIKIHSEAKTAEDMADVLDRISEMIREGCTSGYYPGWDLEGDDEAVQGDDVDD